MSVSSLNEGYVVIGVSTQDAKSHKKFIEKNNLPFPLICDTEKVLVNELGVFGEKKMCGRVSMGVFRTTFIADETGTITRIIGPKKIKVKEHAYGQERDIGNSIQTVTATGFHQDIRILGESYSLMIHPQTTILFTLNHISVYLEY